MLIKKMLVRFSLVLIIFGSPMIVLANQDVEVTVFCSSSGVELELCKEGTSAWSRETGNKVKVVTLPAGWDDVLPMYQQLLTAKSKDIDVLILDTIWPGALKQHLVDMKQYVEQSEIDQHFEAAVEGTTIDGKIVSLPWYMDTGFLFYRKDLLEKYGLDVPKTYTELSEMSVKVQNAERKSGNDNFWGYVWQGRSYEGLTCNAAEWFGSSKNSEIIDSKGKVIVNSTDNLEMLKLSSTWANKISPPGVLNYDEEASRGVFQNGNALFMRNWSYAWSLANSEGSLVKDKVGVVALPKASKDGKNAGCYGTALLGVSKYSENTKVAVDLVQYLTSAKEQKRRAVSAGYSPTLPALYTDKDVIAANPFLADAQEAFSNVVARPSQVTGADYSRVSYTIWTNVHSAISGKSSAEDSLNKMQRELERLKKRGSW